MILNNSCPILALPYLSYKALCVYFTREFNLKTNIAIVMIFIRKKS